MVLRSPAFSTRASGSQFLQTGKNPPLSGTDPIGLNCKAGTAKTAIRVQETMTTDDEDTDPDAGREHLEVLKETIDRNRDQDWTHYRETYEFTLLDDGLVRISTVGETEPSATPIETENDHIVTLDGGKATDCNCHIAQRIFDRKPCRHMRAVDFHPQL